MNFLKGHVEGGAFHVGGVVLPLPPGSSGGNGTPVVYGIRPEHWQLADNGVPATVTVTEPTGSETQVMARIGDAPILCAFRERVMAKPGETIRILPEPSLVHLFDEATGLRLT